MRAPEFAVISGAQVVGALAGREKDIVDLVEHTYRLHSAGDAVNPPSYFLRFPDRTDARIIALPASVGGDVNVDGLKWISSFPANIDASLPRASGVVILNDHDTGYPFACLEASVISASRTAAMAASAADWLTRDRGRPTRLGIVGTGLIARYVHAFLAATGWRFDTIGLHDLNPASTAGLRRHLEETGSAPVKVHDSAEALIGDSDLVVFATIAARPHVHEPSWFSHHPVVLHLSLRDLAPEILLTATNLVDDIEHCLKADTSPHLVEQATGSRDFLAGTLHDVMSGRVNLTTDPKADRTIVFSPFGLGVLDLALAKLVHDQVAGSGELLRVDDFFHDLRRHG